MILACTFKNRTLCINLEEILYIDHTTNPDHVEIVWRTNKPCLLITGKDAITFMKECLQLSVPTL